MGARAAGAVTGAGFGADTGAITGLLAEGAAIQETLLPVGKQAPPSPHALHPGLLLHEAAM
jgi:hypothetical protein